MTAQECNFEKHPKERAKRSVTRNFGKCPKGHGALFVGSEFLAVFNPSMTHRKRPVDFSLFERTGGKDPKDRE